MITVFSSYEKRLESIHHIRFDEFVIAGDIVIKAYTDLDTVQGEDGKPHWHMNNWRHTYQVKTGSDFKFTNLFNGNQLLGEDNNRAVSERIRR